VALNRSRIEGFDLARAVALMGMVVVNFTAMMDIEVYPMEWIGAAVDFIFGRAATVFVMLAGASLSLMADNRANRVGAPGLKSYLIKRCILLLVAGMVLSYWWEADILHFYAPKLFRSHRFLCSLPVRVLWPSSACAGWS
jgi:uncharacterized membrane protein YeiB